FLQTIASDARLIEASREYRLDMLVEELLKRARLKLPVTPTAHQVVEIFAVQQLDDGEIGYWAFDGGTDSAHRSMVTISLLNSFREATRIWRERLETGYYQYPDRPPESSP